MHETDATPSAADLISLLQRQQTLVDELLALADRQAALIDEGDADGLLALLGRRQGITDEFFSSQDRLAKLAGTLRRDRSVDEGSRRRIGELIEAVTARLGEVMRRDESDRARLDQHRRRHGEELAGITTVRRARQAYVGSRALTNRFADEQG